jgi:hypothetical protein
MPSQFVGLLAARPHPADLVIVAETRLFASRVDHVFYWQIEYPQAFKKM